MKTFILLLSSLGIVAGGLSAADTKPEAAPKKAASPGPKLPPTMDDVAYGKHPKQVLTFWKARSDKPTPLLFYIHGGGWTGGSRNSTKGLLAAMLKEGI